MTLRLHTYDAWPRSFVQVTLPTYTALGAVLREVEEAGAEWAVDLDPRWRELQLLSPEDDARSDATALMAAAEVEPSWGAFAPFCLERPADEGRGHARRSATTGSEAAAIDVEVLLSSGAGLTVTVAGVDAPYAPVVEHGVARACRRGPARGYPLADACFACHVTLPTRDRPPALADLHAAAQQATMRALDAAGTVASGPAPDGDPSPLPDLETAVADVLLNLEALCAYPVDLVEDAERTRLGAFIAYQTSMLFGHTQDERMQRQPAIPPKGLQPFLGQVAADLLETAREGPGGEMVGDLVRMWTREWREGQPPPAAA